MYKSIRRHVSVIALVCLLPSIASASWLSDITGVDINIPANSITFGPPRPDRIPQMLVNLPKDAAIFFANPFFGGGLAYAIREAKESARKVCVPIPATVQQTLSPFFPSDFFQGVCWAIVGNGVSLDSYAIKDAGMAAITLEDVVVFRSYQDGQDAVLWSHELTHVKQYRALGVEGFAALYTVAWDAMEQQARDFDQFVARSLQAANQPPRYWVALNGWNTGRQLRLQQFATYARQSFSPADCSKFQHVWTHSDAGPPAYVELSNSCPVPVTVTFFQFRNTQTGAIRQSQCSSDCTVAASTSKRWTVALYEEGTSVSMAWPTNDLCVNGTYIEPSNGIEWNLNFTAQGMNGSRKDGACTISLSGANTWKGQLQCNKVNNYAVTMKANETCQTITSDIGWLQFEPRL